MSNNHTPLFHVVTKNGPSLKVIRSETRNDFELLVTKALSDGVATVSNKLVTFILHFTAIYDN
mgnify:CR=1 FL=1